MPVVDDYLEKLNPSDRAELERVRAIVRATVPDAVEVITYGMPGFKYAGKYLIAYAAFKDHLSIFPGATPVEVLKSKLADFKLAKGTIQFTAGNRLSESLLKEIIALSLGKITKT